MAIKKIHIGFDVDIEIFMKMLQHGNSGMKIEVFGDTPKVKKDKEPKLLEAPKRVGAKNVIMAFAKERKETGFKPKDVAPAVIAAGYSDNTHSPQLIWLAARGLLKQDKEGTYHITTKGMTYGEE